MKKLFITSLLIACALCTQAEDNRILMTIAGEPVTASEFMYIYEKNNQDGAIEKKTMEEYLDLFINFKLKVKEAESQGIDTTKAFLDELKGYRAQATPKYMKDDAAIDSLVRMSYDRMAMDRRAAHIAIECPQNAPDSVQAAALAKIEDARIRVTTGKVVEVRKGKKITKKQLPVEDFKDVAAEVSTDPSVGENRGELGWISPFRYVYSFENAVYTTPVGEVTPVFRSPYGYHIALVEEEIPHLEARARHIMKMAQRGDEARAEELKPVIDSLYAEVAVKGTDFAEVAKAESDDKGSAVRGGELGWFSRGYMVKPFEDATFAMKDSGEISLPVRSAYGWHIIQLEGKRGIRPYEEMKGEIEKKVSRDERMKEAEASFIRKTRAEYGLSESMSDAAVREYADSKLEEKYPEFRNLVREYHDGILLFDVSLAEVWDKAGKDTAGLTAYFKAHKKNYPWEEPRYKGYLVQCKDQQTAKAAKAIIRSAEKDSIDSYLNKRLNLDSVTYVKFQHGMWTKGMLPAVDKLGFKDKKASFEASEDLPVVFVVGKVLKAPEEWSDERGKVTTDYQDALEAEWVKALREKYPVVVNREVFESL